MPWVGYKDSDFLNYLIDQLPHYIFWKDASLVFRGCNKKFAEQFGYRCSKEVVGKTDADFPWASTLRDKYLSDDHKIVSTGVAKLDYEEQQKQFIDIVDQILIITSQENYDHKNPPIQQKELEKKIDEMVYKLYDLTDEEIKIAEDSF